MNVSDRAALAHALLQSLDGEVDDRSEELWDEAIAVRVAEIRSGKAKGIPAEDVFNRIEKSFRG